MAPLAGRPATSDGLHMVAGFFAPDDRDGVTRRWTSPQFTFHAPRSSRVLRLQGLAPKRTRLRIDIVQVSADGGSGRAGEVEAEASGRFDLYFALPESTAEGPVFLHGAVDEFVAEGDIRPLGVLLEHMSVLRARPEASPGRAGPYILVNRSADLGERLDEQWRAARPESSSSRGSACRLEGSVTRRWGFTPHGA